MRPTAIKKLATEWIKLLRLQDYDINFYLKSADCMLADTGNSCFGYCSSSTVHVQADICILFPKEKAWMAEGVIGFPEDEPLERRVERVIVHELVHIYFEAARTGETIITEETSVVRLTDALMKLKYTSAPIEKVRAKRKTKKPIKRRTKK